MLDTTLYFLVFIGIAFYCYVFFLRPKRKKDFDLQSLLEREEKTKNEYERKFENLNVEIIKLKELNAKLESTNINIQSNYKNLELDSLKRIKFLEEELLEVSDAKRKVTSQKKSSEVRLGHIAETLAPFLDQFDFDPENCVFLGKPIDYISFGDDEITFIEVKSGKSQLNSRQRAIRDQVKNKKVFWKEVRIT